MSDTAEEKLVVWALLDTGLRAAELASLSKEKIDGQGHRITIYGKGGRFGSRSKRRVLPLSARIEPLNENYVALNDRLRMTPRTARRLVKRVANRAPISRPVSPHILCHTFWSPRSARASASLPFNGSSATTA